MDGMETIWEGLNLAVNRTVDSDTVMISVEAIVLGILLGTVDTTTALTTTLVLRMQQHRRVVEVLLPKKGL